MSPEEAVADAKRAMAAGDYPAALALFQNVNLDRMDSMPAVRAMIQMARCTAALGLNQSNEEHHRAALARLHVDGLLEPSKLTADMASLALNLAVGAFDAGSARKYLRMLFGAMPVIETGFKVSPAVETATWCRKHAVSVAPLDPRRKFTFDDGQGLGRTVTYRCEATWHATIPDAEIISGWDFALAPTGEVLLGANYMPPDKAFPFMPHAYCETAPAIAHVWPPDVNRVEADALFLGTPERHHFGHWLSEFLPRLRAWDREDSALVIPAELPKKHRDLLARFGVRDDDLIECEFGRRYSFRSLRIVHCGRADAPNPDEVGFLSAALGPGAGPTGGKILFLTREAGTRAPANMGEVRSVLADFGAVEVNLARLSIAEQVDLLKDARAIIGVHGTDLFSLYHLRPTATVIELHWDAGQTTVFGPACRILGLNHHLIVCARADDRGAATYKKDGDIIVDCAKLRASLAAL
jgi:hypothetical protein